MSKLDSSGKPSAVFILALVSGLLMIVISTYILLMWSFIPFIGWRQPMFRPRICPMCAWMMDWFNWSLSIPFITFTLVSGVIILVAGYMAYRNPTNIQLWGTIILVFSALSLLGGGILIIASAIGLASGIIALTLEKT
ncbi:MAG: hypothetical protein ABDH32_01565 [Candidatus Caldarchaeales archaeon]